MAASDSMTVGLSMAQPIISAIQTQISTYLPSDVASAVTAQFPSSTSSSASGSGGAGATASIPASGMGPAMQFSSSAGATDGSAAYGASLAQPVISSIQAQISSFLPSDLAASVTSQFAGASSGSGTAGAAVPVQPTAASLASVLPIPADVRAFLGLPASS